MKQAINFTRYIVVLVIVGLLIGVGPQAAPALEDSPTRMIPENFSELAGKARPGVVNIRTVKTVKGGGPVFRHFFGNPFGSKSPFGDRNPFQGFMGPRSEGGPSRYFKQQSLGSGFIIDREGYIVTNNHVIANADHIKVKLAMGKEFDAKVMGHDPKTDLALIKIKAPDDLTPLEMGDSDRLRVGTWVVAIGSPFGLEQTVTAGIVSAKGRTIGAGPYDDFIQTDASINPGNSGGPLINMKGEVIGINTAIFSQGGGNVGIGFAIPVSMAQGIIEQLKNEGQVTRGWLGVGIQDITPELGEYYGAKEKKGALVTQVFKGDPADKSGIKTGDVIIAVDGKKVSSSRELSRTIANTKVGERTPVSILRAGKGKILYVELTKRKDSEASVRPQQQSADRLGLKLKALAPEMARRPDHSEDEKGVLVIHVESGSNGEIAGIQQGDVIKEINRRPVNTPKEVKK
ncbi:MAG: DegQ family serine endoprotease, partial [Deltaproteobacteria bacterium]|nr:DegQ family serine endoprotease [Deltaproteobacteria bacterium]